MRNATPVLPFKMRRPTHRHYFLLVNFRPFSFFMRTTRAKINPVYVVVMVTISDVPYVWCLNSVHLTPCSYSIITNRCMCQMCKLSSGERILYSSVIYVIVNFV